MNYRGDSVDLSHYYIVSSKFAKKHPIWKRPEGKWEVQVVSFCKIGLDCNDNLSSAIVVLDPDKAWPADYEPGNNHLSAHHHNLYPLLLYQLL